MSGEFLHNNIPSIHFIKQDGEKIRRGKEEITEERVKEQRKVAKEGREKRTEIKVDKEREMNKRQAHQEHCVKEKYKVRKMEKVMRKQRNRQNYLCFV